MAWTAPRTWVTGELVTSAMMNSHVRDDLLALGPSVVGTTIGAIQTAVGAVDGMRARVRCGATPFEFVHLTYDATYGKWVSEPIYFLTQIVDYTTPANPTLGTWFPLWQNSNRLMHVPWSAMRGAGLRPQVKIVAARGRVDATGGNGGGDIRPALYYPNSSGHTTLADCSAAAGQVSMGADASTLYRTPGAWVDTDSLPGDTGAFTVGISYRLNAGSTGTWTMHLSDVSLAVRWVNA